MDIYEAILKAKTSGTPYALATIVDTLGCGPRSAGTKMLVYGDGATLGTVGGGAAEQLVKEDALACIRSGEPLLKLYSPDTMPGTGCKKAIRVFIEPGEATPHLYLIGGGHVAQAVLPYAKRVGFRTTVYDTRDVSPFVNALADADEILHVDSYEDLREIDFTPLPFIIICTHSHETDKQAIYAVIRKKTAYIGMLGAKHKFIPIFKYLREQGIDEETIRSLYAPIGLDIGGETPDEIGLGIMAEILSVRYARSCAHLRDLKRDALFNTPDDAGGCAGCMKSAH